MIGSVSWQAAARVALFATVPITPVLMHVAIATGELAAAATALAAAQLAAGVYLLARRHRAGIAWVAAAGVATLLVLARAIWPGSLAIEAGLVHTALQSTLFVVFARTLRQGRTPLVTQLARRIHGERPAEQVVYTRHVTQAWCVFFAAQIFVSATLLGIAPFWAWSLFVNVLDAPLCVLMFAAEYGYRLFRFGIHGHAKPLDIVRAFAAVRGSDGARLG